VQRFVTAFVVTASMLSSAAHADQPPIPRIGVLDLSLANSPYEEGLREGLRELGYVEGKSLTIEWRLSTEVHAGFEAPAAELVHSKVDLIVALGTPAARAALAATNSIPVVFWSGDPVGSGIAASLARPGANGTGVSAVSTELTAKRLELLKQLVPRARRFCLLMNSSNPMSGLQLKEAQRAAPTLGLQVTTLDAQNSAELEAALRAIPPSAHGFVVAGDILFVVNRFKIARALREARMPAIFVVRTSSDDGLLMSYGPNLKEAMRRMSVYVDKILKGAKPADLPIEQISKYELVIDLRVARELGIKVPQDLLLRADEVIR
jgi:putative ABC transport system substrate-binding protein